MKKAICLMLAMATEVMSRTNDEGHKLVWKQDLTKEELSSIDKDDLDNPWNDQFKVPEHEFKHKAVRKKLRQSAGDEAETEEKVELEGSCPISMKHDTRTNLYMLLYGYIQGLYPSIYYP